MLPGGDAESCARPHDVRIGCRELPALSGVLGPAARADRDLFQRRGFRLRRPRLSAGTGFSAPDMDRVCEIVLIPDVIANVDALATARACAAVSGAERRATERIVATMAEDLASIPQIPSGGIQNGPVGSGESSHHRSSNWDGDFIGHRVALCSSL